MAADRLPSDRGCGGFGLVVAGPDAATNRAVALAVARFLEIVPASDLDPATVTATAVATTAPSAGITHPPPWGSVGSPDSTPAGASHAAPHS